MEHKLLTYAEFDDQLYNSDRIIENIIVEESDLFLIGNNRKLNKKIINSSFQYLTITDTLIDNLTFANCSIEQLDIECLKHNNNINFENCSITNVFLRVNKKEGIERFGRINFSGKETVVTNLDISGAFNVLIMNKVKVASVNITGHKDARKKNITIKAAIIENFYLDEIENVEVKVTAVENLNVGFKNVVKSTIMFHETSSSSLYLEECKQATITFNGNRNLRLHFFQSEIQRLVFNDEEISSFSLHGICLVGQIYSSLNKLTTCDELNMINLTLSEDSKLNFNAFMFNKIHIENFDNKGSFEINSSQIKKQIHIKKGHLGKTVLNNCQITSNQKFWLIDSNIEETKFLNFRWTNGYRLEETWSKELYDTANNYNFTLRESYRQLKQNYTSNGNKIEALEFQKHELRMHYQIVERTTIESYVHKDKKLCTNLGNFLILATHKWASDFGQNMWKPLRLLVLFHFVLFNFLIYTHDLGYEWSLDCSLESTIFAIGDFFTTLIPTHLGKIRDKISITGITDFVMRISSSYFIFYFISATRKYHQ